MSDENTTKLTAVLDRLADNQLADAKRIATHEANYIHLTDVVEKMGKAQTSAMVELSRNVSEMSTNIKLMSSDNEQVREKLETMDDTIKTRICEVRKEFKGAVDRIDKCQDEHGIAIDELKLSSAHADGVDEGAGKFINWFANNWFQLVTVVSILITCVYTATVFIERLPKQPLPTTKNVTIEQVTIDNEYNNEKP